MKAIALFVFIVGVGVGAWLANGIGMGGDTRTRVVGLVIGAVAFLPFFGVSQLFWRAS